MKTYTAVEIATKLKIPRNVAIKYLSENVKPFGTSNKTKHLSWTYKKSGMINLLRWYRQEVKEGKIRMKNTYPNHVYLG